MPSTRVPSPSRRGKSRYQPDPASRSKPAVLSPSPQALPSNNNPNRIPLPLLQPHPPRIRRSGRLPLPGPKSDPPRQISYDRNRLSIRGLLTPAHLLAQLRVQLINQPLHQFDPLSRRSRLNRASRAKRGRQLLHNESLAHGRTQPS